MYGGIPKEYKPYFRIYEVQMRPYVEGEDESRLTIFKLDKDRGHPKKGDMVRWCMETNQKILVPKYEFDSYFCQKNIF